MHSNQIYSHIYKQYHKQVQSKYKIAKPIKYNPPEKVPSSNQVIPLDSPLYSNLPYLEYKTRQNGIINLTYFPTLQLNEVTKRLYSNTISVNTSHRYDDKNEQADGQSPLEGAIPNTHHKCVSKSIFSLKHMYMMT